ncbi:Uncharacterised protein [Mycobacteroides abscessus subsp. massiliense]|nr:Uncharacterised protein [Mycobacteroides abscessus subsp. massiliense]
MQAATEAEVFAPQLGVVLDERTQRSISGALGGGECADADVDLPAAQREDPAVPGEHLALG